MPFPTITPELDASDSTDPPLDIFVKTVTGKTIPLSVHPGTDTVLTVKHLLQQKEGVAVDLMHLLFGGKEVNDDKTLQEVQISRASMLQLVLRAPKKWEDDDLFEQETIEVSLIKFTTLRLWKEYLCYKHLVSLTLSLGNYVPPELGLLTNLKILNINCAHISTLPNELRSLTKLEVLSIAASALQSVPEVIQELTNLTQLSFIRNNFRQIPDFIGNLSRLKSFRITMCSITSFPTCIARLINLEWLTLSDNPDLNQIPNCIGRLSSLKHLSLHNNGLQTLPPSIGRLNNLLSLNVASNQLLMLPPEIADLSNLTHLNVSDNRALSLNPALIGKLDNLATLGARNIRQQYWERDLFSKPQISLEFMKVQGYLFNS